MHRKKIIIIGSGIAGLASAVRLAVQGFEVIVFEKNDNPGGKLGHFISNAYSFDTGPSLFTQPQNIEELFALANEPITDYFSYKTLDKTCKYFYEDGTLIDAYTNTDSFAKEMKEKTGEDENKIKTYLERSSKLYKNVAEIFLNNSLHKRKTWKQAKIFKALRSVKPKYLFKSMNSINAKSFDKMQTVQLFNRFGTYNGSNPFKMPGMFTLIPHLEHGEGIYYPKNGMVSIAKALYQLALKLGVQFHFNTAVSKIICNEGKALGVVANNENHLADIVVSNMDVYFTYKNLLNDESKSSKILKQERSSSALVFFWGIKNEFPQLQLHNIFFSKNYKAEFEHLFKLKKLYNDPTVYINITAKQEPEIHAPKGNENWFVMVNAPANAGQNWNEIKKQTRQNIIQKLNRILQTDIEPMIETEEILDPVLIEKNTNAYQGALYGASSNARLAAFLRHPNFSKKIRNLYFVGGTVHPGGGIPLCLKSAKIACELINENIQHSKH
jgi:phytoene desaturase